MDPRDKGQTVRILAPEHETALEQLRAANQVRLVTEEEEGAGIDRLPDGVYGFSWSPAQASTPLFRSRSYQNFEVHRLAGGEHRIVGFVEPEIAAQINGSGTVHFHLMAEPEEQASALTAIPMWRVIRFKEQPMRDGQGLEIELRGK